jgi:hypothetical protein
MLGSLPVNGAKERDGSTGGLARRILLTLALSLIFVIGQRLPAPGIDSGALAFSDEPSPASLSVLALGIVPTLWAYLIVELVAALVPKWRALRHTGPKGRRKLDRAVVWVVPILAAIQSFAAVKLLDAMPPPTQPLAGAQDAGLFALTLIAGACLVGWISRVITQQEIASGVLLLWLVTEVERSASEVLAWLRTIDAGRWTSEVLPPALALAVFGLVTFMALTEPPPKAQRWAPVPASSIHPFLIATGLLHLLAMLVQGGVSLGPLQPVLSWPGSRTLLLVIFMLALGAGLTFLLNRRRDLALLPPTLLYLACMALTESAAYEAGLSGVTLVTAVLVAAVTDAGVAVVAFARVPGLTSVWEERRPEAIPSIRELLESSGIESHVLGVAQTIVHRVFAPFAATRLCVLPVDAKRAKRLIRRSFGGEADASEIDPPLAGQPAKSAPIELRARLRTPMLAAAALAALLCWGLTSPAEMPLHPPSLPAVTLEFVAVDDRTQPFEKLYAGTLPKGVSIMSEYVKTQGEDVTGWFARVVLLPDESIEQAIRRLEPWWRGLGLPADARVAWERLADPASASSVLLRSYVLRGPPVLTGWDVAGADAMSDAREAMVVLEFTPRGAARLEDFSRNNVGTRFAIVIDGMIRSAPVIQAPISGGFATITLGWTDPERDLADAEQLARALNALPADAR